MKRIFSYLLVVVALVSLLALPACNSEEPPAPTTTAPTTTAPTTTAPTTTAPTTTTPATQTIPTDAPKFGGVLKTGARNIAGQYDPHRGISGLSYLTGSIWNTLIGIDPTKTKVTLETITPSLAESWEVSPDSQTFTFNLRKDVKWHDGMPFTADDVIYTFEKMMDPERSTIFGQLEVVDKVTKIDDYTVKFELKRPYIPFLTQLTSTHWSILAKHNADADWQDAETFLMGTGPFKYKSQISGVSMEFERNPDYWETDEWGRQLPYLDGWELYRLEDSAAMLGAFAGGRTDYYAIGQTPGIEGWKQLDTSSLDITAIPGEGGNWPSIFINKNSNLEPLRDWRVRTAMTMLCNQEELAFAIFKTNEEVIQYNNGIFQLGMGADTEDIAEIMGWDKPWEERVAEAKQLMADAGYPDGGFTVYMPSMSVQMVIDACTLLGETWKEHLGIDYTIDPISYTDYLGKKTRGAGPEAFDVMLGDLTATGNGDPSTMQDLFMSDGPKNFLGVANARVDELFVASEGEGDPVKRREQLAEIERLVMSEHTIMPSPVTAGSLAVRSYVKDLQVQYPFQGTFFQRVWIDK